LKIDKASPQNTLLANKSSAKHSNLLFNQQKSFNNTLESSVDNTNSQQKYNLHSKTAALNQLTKALPSSFATLEAVEANDSIQSNFSSYLAKISELA